MSYDKSKDKNTPAHAFKYSKKAKSSKQPGSQESLPGMELRAGLGFFTGFPLAPLNEDVYTGYGINADAEYFLLPQLSVGLNTGYFSYKHDEIHVGKGHYTMIPIQLRGSWYFLEDDFQPYGGLNAGLFMNQTKYDSIIEPRSYLDPVSGQFTHTPGGIKPIKEKSSVLGLAPMIGCIYKVSEKTWLNVNTRYNLIFTEEKSTGVIGLHFGVIYSFEI